MFYKRKKERKITKRRGKKVSENGPISRGGLVLHQDNAKKSDQERKKERKIQSTERQSKDVSENGPIS